MATKLQTVYDEAMAARDTLKHFVDELAWKKEKSEMDTYYGALASGLLAMCKFQEITLELMRRSTPTQEHV